jgi:hypothetical protein
MVGTTIKQQTNGEHLWITNNSCLITNSMLSFMSITIDFVCFYIRADHVDRQDLHHFFCLVIAHVPFISATSNQFLQYLHVGSKFTPVVCDMSVSSLLLTNTSAVFYR